VRLDVDLSKQALDRELAREALHFLLRMVGINQEELRDANEALIESVARYRLFKVLEVFARKPRGGDRLSL